MLPEPRELSIREVTAGYPGVPVLNRLSLDVSAGRLTGLVGANGAGKSTLFDVVCGRLRARHGRVLLGGRDITHVPTHRRARLGLGRTYQRLEVFGSLSVAENLRVAGGAGVLLLDEPSSGMGTAELADFAETLRALARDGLALLMIEHDMELVEAVCDEVYELRDGRAESWSGAGGG
jgi:branched-chain amino acid transport system ATP-binding protein